MESNNANSFTFDWSYPLAFSWGLLVLGAFAGWGLAVTGWLLPTVRKAEIDWGMSTALGMSVYLILSGPMLMLSLFSSAFVALFLVAGAGFLVRSVCFRNATSEAMPSPWFGLKRPFIWVFLFIFLAYAGAVAARDYNPFDDAAAYFPLTKMLLDTGTMFDPFSFRIIGALGGQTALDALIVAFLPWKYMNLLDMGIVGLIVLGLTQEMVGGDSRKAQTARVLLIFLFLMFSMPRTNIASEYTGVALFMALFRAFDLVAAKKLNGWRAATLLGGIMAANATLRANYIFFLAVLYLGFLAWRLWEQWEERCEIIRGALQTSLIAILFSAPWWEVGYRSCGVFLYPLVRGNHRPEFEIYSQPLSFLGNIEFVGGFLISTIYLLLFLPACFLEPGRQRRLVFILGGALLALSVAFVAKTTSAAYFHTIRYLTPIGLPFGLYTAGLVAKQLVASPRNNASSFQFSRRFLIVFAVTAVLTLQSFDFLIQSIRNGIHIVWSIDARRQFWNQRNDPESLDHAANDYRVAFALIPRGAKTLIALDYPFLLDYRNQQIFSIDVAGAASPAPGLPYFQGAAPVKEYLLAHGIRYIAHVPFDRSGFLHSRKVQNHSLIGDIRNYRFFAKFELDFFNNIDQLAQSNRILYDSPTIRVIDLQAQ